MQNVIKVPLFFDRHLHLREGDMLKTVLPCTINQHATGAVIMGNLKEPTSSVERTIAYWDEIMSHIPPGVDFKPTMAAYLTDQTTPEEIVRGVKEGVWQAVKLYMADQNGQGGTTGSAHGVKNLRGRNKVFEAMQKHRIPLLGHFEAVEKEVDEFDREIVSLNRDLIPLLRDFPELPIVFEHLTDGRVADFIAQSSHELYATVTAHHLIMNRNWMFNGGVWNEDGKYHGGMNPGHYCKPVPKREEHRLRVRKHVTSGNRRFGAGTDSAPHDETAKSHCYGCAAGIFTAPKAVELYTTVFDEDNALEHLGAFLSENFVNLYGRTISSKMMTLRRIPSTIPQKVGNVQVFMGGTELPWTLE